ncbi:uncharacterized protein C6orf132 homolog [Nematolebias whitei]|uniref:uncharacterized protein C6orf132 homolog n=1 Tax=Nematolebias whitei TaxID=451745 RepID=UPI0018993EDE|nr:uncharacterized protein C6orf132 homolog [Nematolebias whitei]XP_037535464.1 uncharacterized protein C6orf132 homolog [Nematolebias whitei]
MKKGLLNFQSRKNQSLFDTKLKIQDMENVELVLDSTKISESGTANVRARPTVKHHTSIAESFQGFAVPTPKVPLLPSTNGPKINGTDAGNKLSNGSIISGHVEDEIFVPPPPSMAPPPPPVDFIPPPPDFFGDLNSLAAPAPPSKPAPKLPPSVEQEGLAIVNSPSSAPTKPLSTSSSDSASSAPIVSSPPPNIPEHPKFAPPQPPQEKQLKTNKAPPPKPARFSSIFNDSPPQSPAPPPTVHTSTFSTFNPQHKAKVLDTPKTTFLGTQENHDARPKQMLLLEESGSRNSVPVLVTVDGKSTQAPKAPTPDPKDAQEPKKDLEIPQQSQLESHQQSRLEIPQQSRLETPQQSRLETPQQSKLSQTELQKKAKTETPPAQSEITKPPQSPQLQKMENVQNGNSETLKINGSPGQSRSFSPMLDRKLRTLKANEVSGSREAPAASPLALLQAAKQRDKNRTTASVSREGSTNKSEHSSASIYPSDLSPNSFVVVPKPTSSSLTPSQEKLQETAQSVWPAEHEKTIQAPEKSINPTQAMLQKPSNGPALSSPTVNNLAEQKQSAEETISQYQAVQQDEELNVPLLPPPPGFDDFIETTEPPPSICPPDPPAKKAPKPAIDLPPPALPNHIPPPPPKLPPPDIDVKPKAQVQTKPKQATNQLPATLSPNQATLLSILQKKMIEMDHKMAPVVTADSSTDDWGTTAPEEDNKVPVVPKAKTQIKCPPPTKTKPASMDMKELEGKLIKKYQQSSQLEPPSSGGAHSKHPYGMTFMVRPGTEQPITLISKGET